MPSLPDGERLRRVQARIAELVARDLEAFWGSLDLRRPELAREALLDFVPDLVEQYGLGAAAVAAEWYDEQRAARGVAGRFEAIAAAPTSADAVEQMVRFGAQHLFTDDPGQTLAYVQQRATKHALQPGRDTITLSSDRDPFAAGWRRVTRAGSCKFCRMLADRGAVYRESTVHFASHGACNCAAVPAWDRDAPEVDVRAYVASQRTSSMSPRQREAHTARVREYLAGMDD